VDSAHRVSLPEFKRMCVRAVQGIRCSMAPESDECCTLRCFSHKCASEFTWEAGTAVGEFRLKRMKNVKYSSGEVSPATSRSARSSFAQQHSHMPEEV
jgi:hypothetical protein